MIEVRVLAFGPVAERLGGRHHTCTVEPGSTLRDLACQLGVEDWLGMGMAVAVNGTRVEADATVTSPVEVAFLPPVSGG